jgi:predicted metalloprotease with PDZ domain
MFKLRKTSVFLFITGLFFANAVFSATVDETLNQQSPAQIKPPQLNYLLRPILRNDRVDLEVMLSYKPDSRTGETVGLPKDCYTVPDLPKYVTAFEGVSGTKITPGPNADERKAFPAPDGTINLKYLLSFDPVAMDHYSFGPNLSADHFHVAGCQWMLRIGEEETVRPYKIKFITEPADWHFYWTLSAKPGSMDITDSYENLASTAYGGTRGPYQKIEIEGHPVEIFTSNAFTISAAEIGDAVEKIIRLQRKQMNDNDFGFYHVVTLPRSNNIAGTAVDGLFVSFVKPEVQKVDLYRNLSHEMFHNWLGDRIRVVDEDGAKEKRDFRFNWLHEGFTEQIARSLIANAGLIKIEDFVNYVNRDLIDLADNPHATFTYDQIAAADTGGKWDSSFFKLSYTRGSLIGLNWETQLRRSSNGKIGLIDLVRDMHGGFGSQRVRLSPEEFFKKAAAFGIDAQQDFDRYIIKGESIAVTPDAFGSNYELIKISRPRYDVGFDITQTIKSKIVTGVIEGGPAYQAGLREGMKLIRTKNSARFSNAWDSKSSLIVVVENAGAEKEITYWPHGQMIEVPQFIPKS